MVRKIEIECRGCSKLLFTFEDDGAGKVLIKPEEGIAVRGSGMPKAVLAICPKCGAETEMDVRLFGSPGLPTH